MVKAVLEFALAHPEASSRLKTLNLAGPYSELPTQRGPKRPRPDVDGVLDDALIQQYHLQLQPGCFANLQVRPLFHKCIRHVMAFVC